MESSPEESARRLLQRKKEGREELFAAFSSLFALATF
jgi:hypothetical protein